MSDLALADELAGQLRGASAVQVDAVVSVLLGWAQDRPPDEGMDCLRRWRDRVELCRSQMIAAAQESGIEGAELDRLIGRKSTTRADRKRVKDRAATIGRNQELADAVDSGRLSGEQLDAICVADAKTDGKAANDQSLLEDIRSAPADAARKHADDFVKAQQTADDLEVRRAYQRKQRDVRKGATTDGLASLTISGDDESVHQMWSALVDTADGFYRADGGRDIKASEHRRTGAQRLFDAAFQHITGSTTEGCEVRPVIVVSATKLAGLSDEPAEMIGVGPIPDSLLDELACGSDFVGMVFDGCGEVLWQGRKHRYPTKAQQLALIVRDRGCVLCGADPQRCQAHHLMPWSAPGRGKTDIDGLALLCGTCHRDLHERNHTLYRDPTDHRWRTRPSTPNETPARRPTRPPDRRPRVRERQLA